MVQTQLDTPLVVETDAVVIGAGIAGIAAAIHLLRSGFRVVCLEQRKEFPKSLGESLDWSAPDLLARLGLAMEDLVSTDAATWKRHLTVAGVGCGQRQYLPGSWLAEPPWNVEIRTLHLDRDETDARLRATAARLGVTMLHERVSDFCVLDESNARKRRILGLRTDQGTFVRASWFIDASGSDASLLARRFRLASIAYGPRKVAIWTHVPTGDWSEGTTLYAVSQPGDYMDWIWEIPIRPAMSSVGYVSSGRSVKKKRAHGLSPRQILMRQCEAFPRTRHLASRMASFDVGTTTFLCRTYRGACGANWIIIGEAASQSDPITGNGVTAALRHAEEAAALICRHRERGCIPMIDRIIYDLRVTSLGLYFNSLIEKLFYQPALRDRLGLFASARIYTVPAWLLNLVYSRLRPRGLLRTLAISAMMAAIRGLAWTAFEAAVIANRCFPDRCLPNRSLQKDDANRERAYAL